MKILLSILLLMFTALMPPALAGSSAAPGSRDPIEHGEHHGVRLTGDLHSPRLRGRHPVLVAVHGGDGAFADSRLNQCRRLYFDASPLSYATRVGSACHSC